MPLFAVILKFIQFNSVQIKSIKIVQLLFQTISATYRLISIINPVWYKTFIVKRQGSFFGTAEYSIQTGEFMQSLKQLVKEFKDQGYANPLIHAECKLWALQKVALAKQHTAPVLKSNPKPIMQSSFQEAIRFYLNNGGLIKYLPAKRERNSNLKVAMPQEPVIRFNSRHKLTPEEDSQLRMVLGVA
jgi:hypothetical protein